MSEHDDLKSQKSVIEARLKFALGTARQALQDACDAAHQLEGLLVEGKREPDFERKMADTEELKFAKKQQAEELRFAKKQQWYVATASVTLNAAAFALLKGSHLHDYEALAAIFFIVFIAAAGVGVLWQLQDHMRTLREPDAPWHRPTDVVVLLTIVVVAVAVAVLYFISSGPKSEEPHGDRATSSSFVFYDVKQRRNDGASRREKREPSPKRSARLPKSLEETLIYTMSNSSRAKQRTASGN